jgi:hypothetical protein
MKKIIRLTESDLLRIIKKVIKEQESQNDKFKDVQYYFKKEGYNPNENKEKELYIDIYTREVFIDNNEGKLDNKGKLDNEGKLEKLPYKIPKKTEFEFDKENKPNQFVIDANNLSRIFNSTATKIEQFDHKDPYNYKIDIVFIDNDKIPKKGKIKLNPKPKEKDKIYIPIQISTPEEARLVSKEN